MGELEHLVHEFETVLSWHTGPRRAKLEGLIARLREHADMAPAPTPGAPAGATPADVDVPPSGSQTSDLPPL